MFCGKPFAGLGVQGELRADLKQCEAYGNAIELRKGQLNVEDLKRVIDKLQGPAFIEKAKNVPQLMNQVDGAENAAGIIRKILD